MKNDLWSDQLPLVLPELNVNKALQKIVLDPSGPQKPQQMLRFFAIVFIHFHLCRRLKRALHISLKPLTFGGSANNAITV
jgi:hypothetical protein